jgi:hypothetical protein
MRTKYLNPDYRRDPKTSCWCVACQRDLTAKQPRRWVHVVNGGMTVLHPDDEGQRSRPRADCRRPCR